MNRRRLNVLLAVAALAGLIAFFALRSSPYLQYIPWMPRSLGRWADAHGISRNFVAFFALGIAVFVLIGSRPLHTVALCLFATGLEVSQLGIRGRIFDWRDIVVSIAGILAAWPLGWLAARVTGPKTPQPS